MNARTPVEALLDGIAWEQLAWLRRMQLPFVTHTGELRFGGVTLRVYRLSDGQRVIDAADLAGLFGRAP